DPKSHEAHFILAHAYLAQSKKAIPTKKPEIETQAIEEFRKSIDLNPKYKPAYDALFEIFTGNDNRHEARGIINDMISKFGKRSELYNDLCRLYAIDGFIEQAIDTCSEAIRISSRYDKNFIYLARSFSDQGDKKKASKILAQAAKRFPKSDFVQSAAGDFYQTEKNYPVAERYYSNAVKINPQSAVAHIGLAQSMVESQKYKEALPHFQQACKLDSQTRDKFQEGVGKARLARNAEIDSLYSKAFYACSTGSP
ncbi:MAG: tetratricopeptide repeat protein, partial [Bdellovibrionales bacterium]|nr:tetratricopeptide repeat protein [Bdellovibrionales bacterium]